MNNCQPSLSRVERSELSILRLREERGYLLFLTASRSLPINLSLTVREVGNQGSELRRRAIDGELECLFSVVVF